MIEIKPEDILVETYYIESQKGKRFQTPMGVKVTHKKTGIVVLSEKSRSQYKNRDAALTLLEICLDEVLEY